MKNGITSLGVFALTFSAVVVNGLVAVAIPFF